MNRFILFLVVTLFLSCNEVLNEIEAVSNNELGIEYLNKGKIEEAIVLFRDAYKLTSKKEFKTDYLRNLAVAFHEINQLDSSRIYFFKAATINELNSLNYLINMADVDLIDGNIFEAISKLEKAIEKGGEGLQTYNSLGLVYYGHYGLEYQNFDKAIEYNKRAYEINNDRITEDLLARTYFEADFLDEAEHHFLKLNNTYPDFLDYYYYLGLIKYEKGKIDEAKYLLNIVVQKDSLYYFGIEHILD